MKKLCFITMFSISLLISAQNFENLHFGTDSTLEIITWNLEHFPKNGQTTINYVKLIIEFLDVDIIAIQELNNTSSFQQLVNSLDNYAGCWGTGNYIGLAYIYNTDVITVNEIYEIYTSYWNPFPRSPMVMDFDYQGERYVLINNHLKCCGDGILEQNNSYDEENRRFVACNLLKSYIDENFSDDNVLIVGDWNDELNVEPQNNVFRTILNDYENYFFADDEIAFGASSNWSYPSWPSHLDHILITNELFEHLENEHSNIEVLKIDECFSEWWQYDQNITDHRPVALRLFQNQPVSIDKITNIQPIISIYPNPFCKETKLEFDDEKVHEIIIINSMGQIVFSKKIVDEEKSFIWNSTGNDAGIYFVKIFYNSNQMIVKKILLMDE